jgi:hypothetical protein
MQTERKYWFPAKRYGWGWGIPSSWQGWVVLAAFAGLVLGSFLFPPGAEFGRYLAYVAALCGLLVGVCWLKGEPPRWRWGGAMNVPNAVVSEGERSPAEEWWVSQRGLRRINEHEFAVGDEPSLAAANHWVVTIVYEENSH